MNETKQVKANPVLTALKRLRVTRFGIDARMGAPEFGTDTVDVSIFDPMGQRRLKVTIWANAEPEYAAQLVREITTLL